MTETGFFNLLIDNISNSSWLEIVAVVFGILSVWYAKRASILVYPTGIVSVLIYVYICFFAGLYADMGINGVYFFMSVYGWILWSGKSDNKPQRPISFCNSKMHLIIMVVFLFFFISLSYVLKNYTDSTVPIWDSITTALFIAGMLLMALKKTENWILWIIGDVISIPLYFSKGLVFTSLQYTIFLVLAVLGYIEWVKIYKRENQID